MRIPKVGSEAREGYIGVRTGLQGSSLRLTSCFGEFKGKVFMSTLKLNSPLAKTRAF